ncbi:MAG: GSU2403 family nucleotidyltransferase fold protein, partial [Dietzia sp.]|nr:GSU2403 family nucleotidyltransferase fold protein [Dietzia sp.]
DGGGVLVSVPDPARFALHKVLIAGERPVIAQAKSEKDLRQAAAVLGVLHEDREGDIALAHEDASSRGKGWRTRLARGLSALARLEPQTAARVSRMLDAATP